MRTIYLDCSMGAAGDMLTAALLELYPDREGFLKKMNSLGLPGVRVEAEEAVKCGITGTHVKVTVHGEEEESVDAHGEDHEHAHGGHTHGEDHEHTHDDHTHGEAHMHDDHTHGEAHSHDHHHHHHHADMAGISHMISHLDLPEAVKADMVQVYGLIAEAEAAAHGKPVDQIHFHEVGTADAVADIAGVCFLMHELRPDQVIASPVHVGSGHVHCAHGILPVPAPATAHILQGIPMYSGSVLGELCTPTGAALLKHFVKEFKEMPVMTVSKIGYGMGKKDFDQANCIRAFLGETAGERSEVAELSCNLDDMTAEELGFVQELLMEKGALEVYTIPVGMKKNRPGTLLSCMCRREDEEEMVRLIFRHTTTLGIREHISRRFTLKRDMIQHETSQGIVREKVSSGYGVTKSKLEYEDLADIARKQGISLREAREQAEIEMKREETELEKRKENENGGRER